MENQYAKNTGDNGMESPYEAHFNDIQMVVMLERDALSNIYSQMMLTNEQKLKVLDLLESFCVHTEDGGFITPVQDVPVLLPEMRDDYTQEEIDAME